MSGREAEQLAQFDQVVPGSAATIIRRMELQSDHRRLFERVALEEHEVARSGVHGPVAAREGRVAVEDEEFRQAETAAGYAKPMSAEYQKKQAELVATGPVNVYVRPSGVNRTGASKTSRGTGST